MTNTIYIHQPEKAVSFTRLPNFLFEAPHIHTPVQRSKGTVCLYPAPDRPVPEKRLGGRVRADFPVLPNLRGCCPASLWAAKGGEHPAGTAICRIGGDPEAGLWKTQPHLPKILRSGSKHRLQEIRLWNAVGLKTALHKYDNQSS